MGRKKKPAKPEPEEIVREILVEWLLVGVIIGAVAAFVLTYAFNSIIHKPPSSTTQGLVSVPAAFGYWFYKAMKRFPGLKDKLRFRASADVKVGQQNLSGGSMAPVVGGYKPTVVLSQAPSAAREALDEPFHDLTQPQSAIMSELVEAQSSGKYQSAFWAEAFVNTGWFFQLLTIEGNQELRVDFSRPDMLRFKELGYLTVVDHPHFASSSVVSHECVLTAKAFKEYRRLLQA
jgi:hypothetical protein